MLPPSFARTALLPLLLTATTGFLTSTGGSAQASAPRALTMEDAVDWNSISGTRLSHAGGWILYSVAPADGGDSTLHVRSVAGDARHEIARGSSARFSHDEAYLVTIVRPSEEETKAAKKEKKRGDDAPKSKLVILDLATGERSEILDVSGFQMAAEGGSWISFYQEEKKEEEEKEEGSESESGEKTASKEKEEEPEAGPRGERRRGGRPGGRPGAQEGDDDEDDKKKDKKDGKRLVVRDLATAEEIVLEKVSSSSFAKDGRHLVYAASTKDEGDDGIFVVHLDVGGAHPMLESEGDYRSISFDDASEQVTFLSNVDDYESDEPHWSVYTAVLDGEGCAKLAGTGTPGVPAGWGVSEHRGPRFSKSGARLLFGTAPLPEPKNEDDEEDDDEKVVVDVWSWTDPYLQPQQLRELRREQQRSYLAVAHLEEGGRVVQLGSEEQPSVTLVSDNDSSVAIATVDLAWRRETSWDTNLPEDVWLLDVATGARERRLSASRGSHRLSPGGEYVTWWDPEERAYYSMAVAGGDPVCISRDVPFPLWNELHDTPQLPRSYGSAGWLEDDAGYVVYDKHDLWLLDPRGREAPVCVTDGVGRRANLRFRFVNIDPERSGGGGFRGFGGFGGGGATIDPEDELLLSAFHLHDKSSGFYRDHLDGGPPRAILMEPKRFSTPSISKEGDVLHYTRSDFREFPDVWVTDVDFTGHRRMSDANPQQAEFRWGSSELFGWHSTDGVPLQGVLFKPDGFDPNRKYPLIVYFYERLSDRMHSYSSPTPGRSSVATSFYTSNDYLVFHPDIPYRDGYPGPSAEAAILPALTKLIDTGFVDEDAIGVQGHSWGGYQIAHLVTRTNVFAAAISGAPVSNMTSAYGGIRWGSGRSRMFQYERTQSRLGGSLWEVPNRFWENSPIFFADKIETPVLILHNDEDGAVPWYQGIEFFVALRRLDRPAWMLNYNGEDHGIGKFQNRRDYAIRMNQFFDHYLKGAPPPVWMAEGIPAVKKGKTLGLELVEPPEYSGLGSQ